MWLRDISATLTADPRVRGWGLVGSFGRGQADDWSDVDLLIIVSDEDFHAFVDPQRNRLWSDADLVIDARRNTPIGATSFATLHVMSGLPIGVDWYVYPASLAAWPRDCQVVDGPDVAPSTEEPFSAWNGRGPRNEPIATAAGGATLARLAMVPIAAKYIARRSSAAGEMLEFLGVGAPSLEPRAQVEALQRLVSERAAGCAPELVAAVSEFLSLVGGTVDPA